MTQQSTINIHLLPFPHATNPMSALRAAVRADGGAGAAVFGADDHVHEVQPPVHGAGADRAAGTTAASRRSAVALPAGHAVSVRAARHAAAADAVALRAARHAAAGDELCHTRLRRRAAVERLRD